MRVTNDGARRREFAKMGAAASTVFFAVASPRSMAIAIAEEFSKNEANAHQRTPTYVSLMSAACGRVTHHVPVSACMESGPSPTLVAG